MKSTNITLRVLLGLTVVTLLAACEAQVSLETAPQAISNAANPTEECQGAPYWKADDWSDDDPFWNGSPVEASNPPGNGAVTLDLSDYPTTVSYRINTDLRLTQVLVKAGPNAYPMGTDGSFTWQEPPAISHVTFCFGVPTTTTTTTTPTTPTTPTTTTTPGSSTTIEGITTLTEGAVTTTPGGDTTSTTIGDVTITTDPGASTTAAEGATTVTEGGGAGDPTTTVEVGAGGLTTMPEGEGTLDPGQETTTSEDEVAGASDESLPYTGAGQVSLGGLGGLLLGAGVILLLLVRRRSRED